jgi:hypothetical protein
MIWNTCYITWEIWIGNVLLMWDDYSWWYYTTSDIVSSIWC